MEANTDARPNLFLVGAAKCGTTSLYEYLRQHPQIFFPSSSDVKVNWRFKEPAFFCPDLLPPELSVRDEQDYLALYAGSGNYPWRGEASTYYLYSKVAPERIKAFSPQARILILLRPPLDQMRSNYNHMMRSDREDIADFHAAVSASDDRRMGRRMPPRGIRAWLDYTGNAKYAPHVQRWLDTFGRDRVKVLLLEDLIKRPAETYREVLAFLGVDQDFLPEFRVHNEAPPRGVLERFITAAYQQPALKRVASTLFPYSVRRQFISGVRKVDNARAKPDPRDLELRATFRPEVQQLATLIGRDLSHWM